MTSAVHANSQASWIIFSFSDVLFIIIHDESLGRIVHTSTFPKQCKNLICAQNIVADVRYGFVLHTHTHTTSQSLRLHMFVDLNLLYFSWMIAECWLVLRVEWMQMQISPKTETTTTTTKKTKQKRKIVYFVLFAFVVVLRFKCAMQWRKNWKIIIIVVVFHQNKNKIMDERGRKRWNVLYTFVAWSRTHCISSWIFSKLEGNFTRATMYISIQMNVSSIIVWG